MFFSEKKIVRPPCDDDDDQKSIIITSGSDDEDQEEEPVQKSKEDARIDRLLRSSIKIVDRKTQRDKKTNEKNKET